MNGSAPFLEETAAVGVDVLSVDWRVSLAEVQERTRGATALQGNLDPMVLYARPERHRAGGRAGPGRCARPQGHVFNLGHGILPDTPVEAVLRLVETVHRLGRKEV